MAAVMTVPMTTARLAPYVGVACMEAPHPVVYRRRRLAAVVVVLGVLALLVGAVRTTWAGAASAPSHEAPGAGAAAGPGPSVHVVQPGDTVWSIARSLRPDGDVRATVDALVAANGGAALDVGDRLLLP